MNQAIETTHIAMLDILLHTPIEDRLMELIQERMVGKAHYQSATFWQDTHDHTHEQTAYHRAMLWSFTPRPELSLLVTGLKEFLHTPNMRALKSIRWTLKLHTRKVIDGYLQAFMNIELSGRAVVINFQPVVPLTLENFNQVLLAGFHTPLYQLEMDDD